MRTASLALLAALCALARGGRGPWKAISREAETAADRFSEKVGGNLAMPLFKACQEECKKSSDSKCARGCHERCRR